MSGWAATPPSRVSSLLRTDRELPQGLAAQIDLVRPVHRRSPVEPGKGNIYPVELLMPGYQLVFVRMLAGHFVDRALVLEEALLALARKIVRGDTVLGAPVSAEAFSFAQRMVSFAPRDGNARARAW